MQQKPHLESKTKLVMTASVNRYINPKNFRDPMTVAKSSVNEQETKQLFFS